MAIGGLNDLQIPLSANIYDPIYPSQHLPLLPLVDPLLMPL